MALMSVWKGMLPLGAAVLMVTACQTVQTTQSGAVGVERRQSMLVSSREMEQASAQSYHKILQQAAEKNALNRDRVQVERVRVVARRLIPATGAFRPDAPGWRWEVNVLTSEELNAWCMAGGKIAFYSGIIERLQLSDDEMAAIMGHEIAHALANHGNERMSQGLIAQLGLSSLEIALSQKPAATRQLLMTAAGAGTQVGVLLPFSRKHESEADEIGLYLMAMAGYNPNEAAPFWQRMASVGGGSRPPEFLSTHPDPVKRSAELKKMIPRAKAYAKRYPVPASSKNRNSK